MHASWTEFVSVNDEAPAPERYGHSLTTFNYDDILVVCFGGTSGAGVTAQVDSVWSWTVAKGWHEVSTSGPTPAPRAWHGASALGTSLYVFGGNRWEAQPGQKPTRSVHGDLWAIDTESWTWRQIVQSAGDPWPAARSAMGMAAHGENILLYGGRGIGTSFLGDLWMYSPATGHWTDVTPSPRLRAPMPRVLATFVSTPFGVFLYAGARQVAATPNARAPLCDLWQLKLDDAKSSAGHSVYVWEDCTKVPMCAVEHTVAVEDGSTPPAATASAGERVVVGHDAHAAAFVEPSHLVVWSGVLGRMPKRGVLSSTPPPPQLTGNLFMIDLAAIERGWSMLPAAQLHAADLSVGPVVPRRWAAMSALGPGRAVVHGGLADQKVLGQATVLEIQEAIASPRAAASSSEHTAAAAAAPTGDLLSLDTNTASAGQDPFSIHSPTWPGQGDGTAAKPQSPGRDPPALGPLKSSSVMSAVLGGVRRGMETISSEAASVIQRVTNTPTKGEGEAEEAVSSGQDRVRFSPPPAFASTSTSTGAQKGAAGFWGSEEPSTPVISRDFIESWLRANSSAAECSVKVLVATTDRLTKPRLSRQASTQPSIAAGPASEDSAAAAAPHQGGAGASSSQHPQQFEAGGSAGSSSAAGGAATPAGPSTPLTVQTGTGAGGSDEEGDVESPVSLWISPSPTGPRSPLSADQHSMAFSSSRSLQAADEDAIAVLDIMAELIDRVADSGAQQASAAQCVDGSREEFQFDQLPSAIAPAVTSVWPLGPPDSAPQQVPDAASAPKSAEADKDLPTAYVQDMLTTDPVHELGLRVTRISSSTLEFVSLSEAKIELRRAACAWLLSVPCAACLRRKDIDALWTEYRRAAPNAMALFGKNSGQKLGTLMHLARKDLRMRDIPKLLSEFKQLRQMAPGKSRAGAM